MADPRAAERAAYRRGVSQLWDFVRCQLLTRGHPLQDQLSAEVKRLHSEVAVGYYPRPKIVRPREVRCCGKQCGGRLYRMVDGQLFAFDEFTRCWEPIVTARAVDCTPCFLRVIAELKENPTEEVDDVTA